MGLMAFCFDTVGWFSCPLTNCAIFHFQNARQAYLENSRAPLIFETKRGFVFLAWTDELDVKLAEKDAHKIVRTYMWTPADIAAYYV